LDAILGIDAAWTTGEPSGVALIQRSEDGWRCLATAPSYEVFLNQAKDKRTDWRTGKCAGCLPNIGELLRAARETYSCSVGLISIDMPVAKSPFQSRRVADRAVSREFGGRWCSTHTPSANRPGALGETVTKAIEASGFPLRTKGSLSWLSSFAAWTHQMY
jgi:hypothetical protein